MYCPGTKIVLETEGTETELVLLGSEDFYKLLCPYLGWFNLEWVDLFIYLFLNH